jgi:hypothetical protein
MVALHELGHFNVPISPDNASKCSSGANTVP